MRLNEIRPHQFHEYNMGGREPEKEIVDKLSAKDKRLRLLWNQDDFCWEVYSISAEGTDNEVWTWQVTYPYKELAGNFTQWLAKYDTSEGGRFDDDDRKKQGLSTLKELMRQQRVRKDKQLQERYYELGHICKFLERMAYGTKQVVVPEQVVGMHKGKPIRAYKKRKELNV